MKISVDCICCSYWTYGHCLPAWVQKLRLWSPRSLCSRTCTVSFRVRRKGSPYTRHQKPKRSERRSWQCQRIVQFVRSRWFYTRCRIHRRPRARFQRCSQENRRTPPSQSTLWHWLPSSRTTLSIQIIITL